MTLGHEMRCTLELKHGEVNRKWKRMETDGGVQRRRNRQKKAKVDRFESAQCTIDDKTTVR